MRKQMTVMAAVFVFTACDGNPFETPVVPDVVEATPVAAIPEPISSNVSRLAFNASASTIQVEISGLASTPASITTFERNLSAERNLPAGHLAYTLQEDPLDRFFTAVVSQSADGKVRGGVVSDGGQFNRFFSGVYYERDGDFTPPASTSAFGSGQVSYAGDYVGLDNWSGPTPVLPEGTDPSIQMDYAGRVTGEIFLNVNFTDNLINGSIFNRQLLDQGSPSQIPTIILAPGNIAEDGTYTGESVEANIGGAIANIGSYAGIFGGENAASTAGGLILQNFDPDRENESEHGFWVLNQCGKTGEDAALCNGTRP